MPTTPTLKTRSEKRHYQTPTDLNMELACMLSTTPLPIDGLAEDMGTRPNGVCMRLKNLADIGLHTTVRRPERTVHVTPSHWPSFQKRCLDWWHKQYHE